MKATFKLLSQEGKAVNFLQPQKQKIDVRFDPTFFQACSWLDSRRLQLCGALEALCKHCTLVEYLQICPIRKMAFIVNATFFKTSISRNPNVEPKIL